MTATQQDMLSAATELGAVRLYVENLDRMRGFYHTGVGLDVLQDEGSISVLGRGNMPVLILEHKPNLSKAALGSAGLYHTAVVYETEAALASVVYSLAKKFPQLFTGSSDHLVSKAFYFNDPEGNGVELYWDRPRDQWPRLNGQIQMDTLYLDPNQFLQEHLTEAGSQAVLPSGAQVGHVHLQVGDIPTGQDFSVNKLGFDLVLAYGSQALFVSAGGYHHHIGMNTWQSKGAGLRSPALGLGQVSIMLPTTEEVAAVNERLRGHGVDTDFDGETLITQDPWNNSIKVSLGS